MLVKNIIMLRMDKKTKKAYKLLNEYNQKNMLLLQINLNFIYNAQLVREIPLSNHVI